MIGKGKLCKFQYKNHYCRLIDSALDLAPLTTVGNLVSFSLSQYTSFSPKKKPFRRLCVDLGADITCGESMSSPLPPYSPPSHSGSLSPTPLRLKRRMVPLPPSSLRIHFWRPTRREPAKRPRLRRRGHRAPVWFRRGRFRRCQLWMSDWFGV